MKRFWAALSAKDTDVAVAAKLCHPMGPGPNSIGLSRQAVRVKSSGESRTDKFRLRRNRFERAVSHERLLE